jgi:RimJ/RimL family protein N-acetyltransferase
MPCQALIRVNAGGRRQERVEHLAGDAAFETTDDVALGHSLCSATSDVGRGALITGEAHHDDAPECVVGDAIATAVEAMPVGLPGQAGTGPARLDEHPDRISIWPVNTRLQTARLVIRTLDRRDADAWIAMVSDPEVRRFLPPGPPPTMDMFERALESRHAMEREIGYAMWAVDDLSAGTFIGQCGLRPVKSMDDDAGSEIDLGYHYTRASWNKGFGTEAAIAVLAHGLGPIGLDSIMAVAHAENVGSWRVMEKTGMRYEGLADMYGVTGLKKYVAEREWWSPPTELS